MRMTNPQYNLAERHELKAAGPRCAVDDCSTDNESDDSFAMRNERDDTNDCNELNERR
jgi:hypothetical protein